MNIPTYEFNKVVNEDGEFTDGYRQMFSQLLEESQQNLSNNGFVIPPQPTAVINDLTAMPNGTMIYDSDTNEAKIKINGTFVVFAG